MCACSNCSGPRPGSAGRWRSPAWRSPPPNFVEPILFGRIVDTLANAQGGARQLDWNVLMPLVGAWVGFGLFIIVASTIVSLHADRLAHRHCQAVRADYFEHILQLPLSYHTGTHSGRLMKVMITGTNTLWGLWLSFFREHFTSFVSLFILMPLTLFLNWRYALMLMLLCAVFAVLIAFVLRRTETLQSTVETYYTDQAERTSDTLGNIALIQSFARIDMEVNAMRKVGTQLLGAQMPVLWWWALATVLTKASTTITMLAILIVGIFFYVRGQTTVGEIVMFMSFATMLIGKLEQVVHFANHMVMEGPRLQEFFDVLDTIPAVRDRPDAVDPGRLRGLIEFKDVSFSYDGKRPAVLDLNFTALPGETIALVGADRRRQVDGAGAAAPRLRPAIGRGEDRRHGHPRPHAVGPAQEYRRGVPGGAAVQPLDRRQPAGRQARRDRGRTARRLPRARRRSTSSSATRRGSKPMSASAAACCRAASASASRSRARC